MNFNIGIAPALETHCRFEKTHGWVQDNDWPKKIDGAAWQALFLQVALATTLLAEGMARTAAGAIDGGNVRSLLVASSIKYKFPFGRALNAIGTINQLLTGRWGSLIDVGLRADVRMLATARSSA